MSIYSDVDQEATATSEYTDEFEKTKEEIDEEEVEEEEEEEEIYDSATFVSGPKLSPNSTVPYFILEFDYSYGYDCRKNYNLVVLDNEIILFGSGNFLNFFNVKTGKLWFRRTALGNGIGHIRKNPKYPHFAIAENGDPSLIIIYEWPSLEIFCLLKQESILYSYLDYSPDGNLLVSQSGEPDYNITIWNWPKKRILLRTKSYVNDVYRAKFSPYVPGQLITAGAAHIKFWKMVSTFTGLKLLGEVGRFGKTEYSDIMGIFGMPDGKVISGCKWGNILLWDDSLIKLEVFRTLKRTCHDAQIIEFSFAEEELWTVSMDGHIRVWWYEKIDQADPPDDDRTIQIEPTYDFDHPGLMIYSIKKKDKQADDAIYYAQDGNGGIWQIDLNTDQEPQTPNQLLRCHAGKIVDIAVCPWATFLASLGEDGRIYIYNYHEKKLIFNHSFPAKGGSLIWLPLNVSKFGDELVLGFDDGTLRIVMLSSIGSNNDMKLHLTQVIKPHTGLVTAISSNKNGNVFVSGSTDATLFIFQIQITEENLTNLIPIGYVELPEAVTCLTWNCQDFSKVILGCSHGEIVQVTLPEEPQDYTTISYLLNIEVKVVKFVSYKSQIRRDIKLNEIAKKKLAKVERKKVEFEKIKRENPLMQIDEETYLADSDEEEELEPLYYPPVPNPILWIYSLDINNVLISVAGFDNGYIYKYKLDQSSNIPTDFYLVEDDMTMNTLLFSHDRSYKIMALGDGAIRVYRHHEDDPFNFTDYWTLTMHDNLNGFVSQMMFSSDERFLFTCGHDGNLFSLKFDHKIVEMSPSQERISYPVLEMEDQDEYSTLSLEQAITKKEEDRINKVANENKQRLRDKLKILTERFEKLKERNNKLLPSQIIDWKQYEFDPRITEYIENLLENNMKLTKRKLLFDVEKSRRLLKKLKKYFIHSLDYFPFTITAINKEFQVSTLKTSPLREDFEKLLEIVEKKIAEDMAKGRVIERQPPPTKAVTVKPSREPPMEYFLMVLSPETIANRLGVKLTRFLLKYRDRKRKWLKREEEWENFLMQKPLPDAKLAEDEALLAEAAATIGDFKLKSDPKYKPSKEKKVTKVTKYKELLETRRKEFELRHNFNRNVFELRSKKSTLKSELMHLQAKLESIHLEIDEKLRKNGPRRRIKTMYNRSDYPELNFQINVKLETKKVEKTETIVCKLTIDSEERELLTGKKPITYSNAFDYTLEELLQMGQETEHETPWERELKARRLKSKLSEQDTIIDKMNMKIKIFDNEVEDLTKSKLEVQLDATFYEHYICTLYQELLILKDFETTENALQDKVNNQTDEVLKVEDCVDDLKKQISEHNDEITKMKQEIGEIEETFENTIIDNSFADFLKKVFKKKMRPPKQSDDSDSSSESSETSSEEEDAASIDSRDFTIIKQDLNVCPKGCEPSLFEVAVNLRGKKFQITEKIAEQLRIIESKTKEKDIELKKLKEKKRLLDICIEELEKYQLEKQTKLNQVSTVAILKYDQIQNFEDDTLLPIDCSLLFSEAALIKLFNRVDELNEEIEEQINQHNQDVRHLARMNTDIRYMKAKILNLEREVIVKMKQRFGKVINLSEVEEALIKRTFGKDDLAILEEFLLKNMILDLRLSQFDIKAMYIDEIKLWKNKVQQAQQLLLDTLSENTAKLDLLTLLKKEKTDLETTIEGQDKKRSHLEKVQYNCEKMANELEKLREIVKKQNQQIELLRNEISMLKVKGLPPKAFLARFQQQEEEEEEEEWEQSIELEPQIEGQIKKTEVEELAADILQELLDNLSVEIEKSSLCHFIQGILDEVLVKESFFEIKEMLMQHLSTVLDKCDEKETQLIDSAAEQIYSLQLEKSENPSMEAIIEKIVDDAIATGEQGFVTKLLSNLVDQLPIDVIKKRSNLEIIVNKGGIDVEELEKLAKTSSGEILSIVEGILDLIKYDDEKGDDEDLSEQALYRRQCLNLN